MRVSWICINIVMAGYQLIVINKTWKSIKGIKRNLCSHKLRARNLIAGVVGRTIVLELNTSILIGINQARTPINVKKPALRCNRSLCSIVIILPSMNLLWNRSDKSLEMFPMYFRFNQTRTSPELTCAF